MSPSQPSNTFDSSDWFSSNIKLRFFTRIRRLFRLKASHKQHTPSDQVFDADMDAERESDCEGNLVILPRAVKRLHFGSWGEKEAAAEEIGRLAKDGLKTRKSLAELGVVPPLVAMVGEEDSGWPRRRAAVRALLELANGTCTNKALIVEAGILSKLPKYVDILDESPMHELAQLLLAISSLANNQFPLTSSMILPLLVGILESNSSIETKESCLGTLYNLSTTLDTAGTLATNAVVHHLLRLSLAKETSDKALVTLGNLVVTLQGKKAMESNSMVPENLIEILTWEEKPKSQELSAYILMVLAHQSSSQREKMANSGIVPLLLEVALLGSPLAQKRALRLLQWFKDERNARLGPYSGPQRRRIAIGSPVRQRETNEGKKMMKKLVQQSLYKNMETITRRAHGDEDSCSKLKALVISSSSKSLPY
ncbi:U-box domain-containing protein [Actinidia chinensis var. chinensis]|uniref:U-box domain-containing protein n=1 Tax=Actinidia chinensis var. chinensis TaxID=1590841 RepID=A0A2R6PY09_ACTCC|nr:U-box domain-containing protein [Actinidia chinensis var. chinensis]